MKSRIKMRHLILLMLFVMAGCNSNSRNNRDGDTEKESARTESMVDNDAGISSPEGGSPFVYTGISEELLWDVFLKIPEDSIPDNMYTTVQQRLQARSDSVFRIGHEDDDNVLEYDVTDINGVRNFMRLACYPTDDGKKIIVIYHRGGGVDIFRTSSDQTYEYDIATGSLNAIERPLDPYTADEFFCEPICSPGQLRQVREGFHKKKPLNYVYIDRGGYSMYLASYAVFDDWDDYEEYRDLMSMFYENGDIFVRRDWNGKRFVKAESFPPDYLIDDKSVGRFKIEIGRASCRERV